jgi:two-component system chemotaxis response regulator CheY
MARSVLVVDDSTTAYAQLKKILDGTEFTVVAHATNAEEAVAHYAAHKPELVTMDIVMPGADGVEAVKRILASDPAAKIVIVSSMGGVKERVVAALSAGAKNVVAKPFEKERVLQVLRAVK